jgi:hypothetical protein
MTTPHEQNQLEHQRLLRVAREYRRKGYTVTLYPESSELPSLLTGFSFDLIARREDKTIAVEVRTKENLTLNGPEDLRNITSLIRRVPNWEFELIVTNPRRKAS